MLCVAPGQLTLYVRSEKEAVRDTKGNLIDPGYPAIHIKFIRGGSVPDYAKKLALEKLSFTGLPYDVHPFSQICWLDTHLEAENQGWSAEDLKVVEDFLARRNGQGFVIAERPKLEAPWPAYDSLKAQGKRTVEMVAEKIAQKVSEDGYDVGSVLEYERQNLNRPQVVAALEALVEGGEQEDEPLLAV